MAYRIGQVIDARSDGSYCYMSHKGVLNLDNSFELEEAIHEDKQFLRSAPSISQAEQDAMVRGANQYASEKMEKALGYLER